MPRDAACLGRVRRPRAVSGRDVRRARRSGARPALFSALDAAGPARRLPARCGSRTLASRGKQSVAACRRRALAHIVLRRRAARCTRLRRSSMRRCRAAADAPPRRHRGHDRRRGGVQGRERRRCAAAPSAAAAARSMHVAALRLTRPSLASRSHGRRLPAQGGHGAQGGASPPRARAGCRAAASATTAGCKRPCALRALTQSAPPAQVMGKNVSIYKSQASALEKFAAKDVKARSEVAQALHLLRLTGASGHVRRWLWSPTRRTRTR